MVNADTLPDSGRSFSVLVVEDEFLIAMDVEDILTRSGHEVVGTAASVADALHLLEDLRPDVAVLDVNLRGATVSPVALRLQELAIPFVLSSAYSFKDVDGSDVLAKAVNVGKPIAEDRLLKALQIAVIVD